MHTAVKKIEVLKNLNYENTALNLPDKFGMVVRMSQQATWG